MNWPNWLDSPLDIAKWIAGPSGLYALMKTWRRGIRWSNADVQLQRCREDNTDLLRDREQARRERDTLNDRIDDLLAALAVAYADGSGTGSGRRPPTTRPNGRPTRTSEPKTPSAGSKKPRGKSAAATSSSIE